MFCPKLYLPQRFSFTVSFMDSCPPHRASNHSIPHEAVLGDKGTVAGIGTVGIRATSLCNFSPAWTQSYKHHFQLMMDCCFACSTLWLGR